MATVVWPTGVFMIVYTERYMQTPQENANGYDDTTNKPCEQIERKILLIHGSGDDNVHVQNSMQMMEALIQAI
jgi:dipeptidyl-peptidase-4